MVAYGPTNTIILTDTSTNIRRLLTILKEIDVETFKEELAIIKIQHADASTLGDQLSQIYSAEVSGQKASSSTAARRARSARKRAGTTSSIQPASRGKVRIITDSRTNSLILLAARGLIDDMLETMYAAPGIGLAAPQVGVLRRVIVLDMAKDGEQRQPYILTNPELTWVSDQDGTYEEGCLSLPDHYADVVRPEAVKLRYLDRDNETRTLEAEGILATCIQHEIDHLDGILFVDHISALKRNMILRKLLRMKKSDQPRNVDPAHVL